MADSMRHRGPDSSGFFRDGEVALGHRRLSIIDVAGGQQPLENEDGSLVLICNGEIYNYQRLRQELIERGHRFRTRSDSEVVLHLYEESGPACLSRLNGMFALALFDRRTRQLFLARDRIGIKPLYYARAGSRFLFASEIKALLRWPALDTEVDALAIHRYLALRYVPGPGTLFHSIHKLPAAHYAIFAEGELQLVRYWQPELWDGEYPYSEQDYEEQFRELFERSVRRRLISEVPVGAYLSGGLDSSVIVAAFSKLIDRPVKTFSVGFGYSHDEIEQAAETARHLGCDHTQVDCTAEDLLLLPTIVHHLDEPIGDPIVVPMYLLAREATKQVTVILTGEGADEIFGGYLFHRALLGGRQTRGGCRGP
ncbi:MAG: asparagine synthase (glutamine-hydrolyzing) [Thermoanaerobaculia bacterium]